MDVLMMTTGCCDMAGEVAGCGGREGGAACKVATGSSRRVWPRSNEQMADYEERGMSSVRIL